ncbi:NADPH:quinone reductase-like Zn-dependent oxidoreductase [Catalinimonas alkaloidigena]|uniref:NAD(P)-dependent alcohol dehydrogenase n=1 Tax=Catalinimonas alkaloidigena TaxID=1075417 RepID=UPI0024072A82|nr:NAD(P)-dependent alcohol dehydrogenase [Catalinimonas alkaloidigena]MDF9798885.1 NADPH:quinone reductase-like Zn-dependent oxidoreductase [Catalinimonas alkaloidigena]
MKAFTKTKYGGPEVLQLEEVEKPSLKDDQFLVKVVANSANPADWHILRGKPFFARFSFGLFKPTNKILGADFAGIVEEVGRHVKHFKVGDRVFGESLEGGAFAEYTPVVANECSKMPEGTGFAEMACVPIAGLTALQALVNHGQLKEGESVFINGASGGVGHFTVQIARAYGAKVTAVCSSKNIAFVKALGADQVIAYDKENIHHHNGKYDLIIDTHGNLFHSDYKRMGQRGVMVGFTSLGHMISLLLKRATSKFPLQQFTAKANTKDLETLASLIQNGKVQVYVEKTYSYKDIPEAIGYIEAMRTRGKVAMLWEDIAEVDARRKSTSY